MSLVTLCDICGQPAGSNAPRLQVAGQAHPHKGEPISEDNGIDVCVPCLKAIPDLSTGETLETLKLRRGRANTENPNG